MTGRHSIRLRITLTAVVVVALVLVVTAVVVVALQRSQLTDNLDASLQQRADDAAAILTETDAPVLRTTATEVDRFVQLLDGAGTVIGASENVVGMGPALAAPSEQERLATVSGLPVEDDEFRVLARRVADGRTLIVAENIDDVNDAVRALALSFAGAIPAVVAVLGLLVWWLVGRTLRPVEQIQAEVATIRGDSLDRRVPLPETDDEIRRLALTMNEMLDRVEEAGRRQRNFVADASHELRSPLTRLRTSLEVELDRDDAHLAEVCRDALANTVALQALIDDLLMLARSDAGAGQARREAVDLDDIVLREARRLRETPDLGVDTSAVSAAHVVGDPAQLLRLVRNLADNARRHAASVVAVSLGEQGGVVALTVEDDGPGVADVDLQRLFERFTRLDDARSTDSGGTGLGLAIVRDVARRHGGTAVADRSRLGGLRVIVELPQRGEEG